MSKTRFLHVRNESLIGFTPAIEPRGGMTFMVQQAARGSVHVSIAECSLEDNYCRKTGRQYASQKLADRVDVDALPTYLAEAVERSSKRVYAPNVQDFGFMRNYFD